MLWPTSLPCVKWLSLPCVKCLQVCHLSNDGQGIQEECVCCQEIQVLQDKNEEVFKVEKLQTPYSCITYNPGFHAVCINRWTLQAAWFQYKQQYGTKAFEGPEHKNQRHIAYRQLVCWCWGVLGKEIQVVLPACAVSCIRAHFPPLGEEDEHAFIGFLFADE